MPTYEYECTNGHQFEAQQRITEEPLQRCRVCRAKARRLISSTNFILKGGGWYSDGYSSGSGNGKGKVGSGTAAGGSSNGTSGSSSSDSSGNGSKSTSSDTSSDSSKS